MVEYFGATPLAKNGIRPQRSRTPSLSPPALRTTGTCCVGATLKLASNRHHGFTIENARSIDAWSLVTYRPHIVQSYKPTRGAGNATAARSQVWTETHVPPPPIFEHGGPLVRSCLRARDIGESYLPWARSPLPI